MSDKPFPTLEWIHVCDHAFRDEHGKLCLIGMFDNLASMQLPGRLPVFCVAFGITGGRGEYELGLQIEAPSGKAVNMKMPPLRLNERNARVRTVLRLQGMPFEEWGTYVFRMVIEGAPLAEPVHRLDHMRAEQQGQGTTQSMPQGFPPPPDFPMN